MVFCLIILHLSSVTHYLDYIFFFKEQAVSDLIKFTAKLGRGPHKINYTILAATLEDEGHYVCQASNELGSNSTFADIKIIGMYVLIRSRSTNVLDMCIDV